MSVILSGWRGDGLGHGDTFIFRGQYAKGFYRQSFGILIIENNN